MINVQRYCKDNGLEFYLNVALSLPPVRASTLHVQDYYGSSSRHACINSPATKAVLHEVMQPIVQQGLAEQISGFSISMQDFWPMSATKGVVRPSCFCRFCRDALASLVPDLWERADQIADPFAVALRDAVDGIASVNRIFWETTPEVLLTQSAGGGFIDTEVESAQKALFAARWVIDYTHARHESTVLAIRDCIAELKTVADVPVSGSTTDTPYDWTSGLFFGHLVSDCPVDEIWVDPSPEDWALEVQHRYYLLDRANYYLNGFAEAYEEAARADSNSNRLARELHQRAENLRPRFPSRRLAIASLPPESPKSMGVVVPPFVGPQDLEAYLDKFPVESDKTPLELLQEYLSTSGEPIANVGAMEIDDENAS